MPYDLDFSLKNLPRKARFQALYGEAALYRAVLKTYTKSLFYWRKAIAKSHDERTLYDFARQTPQNVERLHDLLKRRAFHFREATEVKFNFNGRERTVFIFPWEERIVDLFLYQVLNRHFHTEFSRSAYAYRHRGFGVDVCQHRIARRLKGLSRPVYFLKRDISDYFPSMDHGVLLEALTEWIEPDDYLYELLEERVRFEYRAGDAVAVAERGVPFGSAIACFFANFYLTPLDRALGNIEQLDHYRYADDILAFSADRAAAGEATEVLAGMLHELKLESKPSHHQDFAFLSPGEADAEFARASRFRHLGLEYRGDGSVGLSRDKARKIRNLFRFAFRRARKKFADVTDPEARAQLVAEIAREVVESRNRSVAIIDYYLKHVDDEGQLRLLDRWLAEEALAIAFQNGHRKGNFRMLPFSRLREMGLPSLRHRRRLLRHGHLRSSFFRWGRNGKTEYEKRRLSGLRTFSPRLKAAAERPNP